ncbi:hypothetical protein [Rosistilla oblonga]|uniref:Uncharacterized protein n=1 Tax=Rosistilla oblonga TaxID=2527990 RepID=A0A518ITQ5_9BACT|nr:hypothetical protein [Rosistilla oblonga]QDV56474.1 hypothetical protein Mal33_24640 [Rosistilla oblonga]
MTTPECRDAGRNFLTALRAYEQAASKEQFTYCFEDLPDSFKESWHNLESAVFDLKIHLDERHLGEFQSLWKAYLASHSTDEASIDIARFVVSVCQRSEDSETTRSEQQTLFERQAVWLRIAEYPNPKDHHKLLKRLGTHRHLIASETKRKAKDSYPSEATVRGWRDNYSDIDENSEAPIEQLPE